MSNKYLLKSFNVIVTLHFIKKLHYLLKVLCLVKSISILKIKSPVTLFKCYGNNLYL